MSSTSHAIKIRSSVRRWWYEFCLLHQLMEPGFKTIDDLAVMATQTN